MPRRREPKKDVLSCEKPGGGAQDLGYRDIQMEEPAYLEGMRERGKPAN